MRKFVIGDQFKRVGHLCEIIAYEPPNGDGVPCYRMKFFSIDGNEKINVWSETGIINKMTHVATPKPKIYLSEDLFTI